MSSRSYLEVARERAWSDRGQTSSAGRRLGEVMSKLRPKEDPLLEEMLISRLRAGSNRRPRAGADLGRYRITAFLGRGGMGTVYQGYDPELRRRVAVKVLRDKGPEALEALRLEAQLLSKARHPNTVETFDVGHTPEGRVYFVMELVDGPSLREWLTERPRNFSEIIEIFGQCAVSLHAAHTQGVVHGDFKPDNVLVTLDGVPKITDFGLARITHTAADPLTTPPAAESPVLHTPERRAGGTSGYLAPELLVGELSSPASDQYAFCVALHEAVFGMRPSESGSRNPPPKIPRTSLRRLDRILRRGLRPRPNQRFASMLELSYALHGARFRARRRVAAAGLGISSALAILFSGNTQHSRVTGPCEARVELWSASWNRTRREAVEQTLLDSPVPYLAAATPGLLTKLDSFVSDARRTLASVCEAPASPRRARALECLDMQRARLEGTLAAVKTRDSEILERALSVLVELDGTDPCAGAGPWRRVLANARVLADLGRYDEAQTETETLRADALRAHDVPTLAASTLLLGRIQRIRGRYAESVASLEDALWTALRLGQDGLVVDAATALVSVVGRDLGEVHAAAGYLELAEAAAARVGAPDDSHADPIEDARAELFAVSGRPNEAIAAFESLARRRMQRPKPATAAASRALVKAASVSIANAHYEHAQTLLERALELARSLYGDTHTHIAELHSHLSRAALGLGDSRAAVEYARKAIDTLERAHGPEHPALVPGLTVLATTLERRADFDGAERILGRARAISLASFGDHHPKVARVELAIGVLHHLQADWDAARAHYERARAIMEVELGPDHRDLAWPLCNLALVLEELGEHAEALELYRRAFEIVGTSVGPHGVLLAGPMSGMGRTYSALGQPEQAIVHLERVLELIEGVEQDVVVEADVQIALAEARFAVEGATPKVVELARTALDFYERVEEPRFATALAHTEAFLRRIDA